MIIYLEEKLNELSIHNEILSFNDIKEYCNEIINYLELNNYVKDIIDSNEVLFASYNTKDRTLKINYDKILLISKMEFKYLESYTNITLFTNMEILNHIFHEIVHALQYNTYMETDYSIGNIYGKDFIEISEMEYDRYNKYYHCFPIEREANIVSLENILTILNNLYSKEVFLYHYYENVLINELLSEYEKDYSPLEKLYKEVYKMEVPTISGIDEYNKIKLGLPISNEMKLDDYSIKKLLQKK